MSGDDAGDLPRAPVLGISFWLDAAASESWLGRVKKLSLIIFGFVMGIVSQIVPDLIKALWTHHQ